MIYFLRSPLTGLIKIGHTTKDTPADRVTGLATGAGPLDIVATLEGDKPFERALHKHFADDRVHGEWFRLTTGAIQTLVENHHAKRSTGTVIKRGATYHVRYAVDGRTIQESAQTGDKREARRFLADRLCEIAVGVWRPPREREAPRSARDEVARLEGELDDERANARFRKTVQGERLEMAKPDAIAGILEYIAERAARAHGSDSPAHRIWLAAAEAARRDRG